MATLLTSHVAYAATIPVTSTQDEMTVNGECSLREAVEAANTDSAVDSCPAGDGADTIVLEAKRYDVTLPGDIDFDNSAGALTIKSSLTISGAGAQETRIVAAPGLNDALVHVGASSGVVIQGVTLQGGERVASLWNAAHSNLTLRSSAVVSGTGEQAGGIHNQSQLTLIDSTVAGNETSTGAGGINNGGTLTMTASTVTDNHATTNAGGISSSGPLQIYSSTISSNVGQQGGGIIADEWHRQSDCQQCHLRQSCHQRRGRHFRHRRA